jgi:hypothetical protein
MLRWLRKAMGGSAVSGVAYALEELYNPSAARARKEQEERVVRVPSPGDKLLDEGKVVIRRGPVDERPEAHE